MTVTVYLRSQQTIPLDEGQVDSNFTNLANAINVSYSGGPTANRPTNPTLYQPWMDTTLGYPVWCISLTPSVKWVNAAGFEV